MDYPEGQPDVLSLGSRHFIRAHHYLVRTREAVGEAVLAGPDSEVLGLTWWHDCRSEESRWILQYFPVDELRCPFTGCGDAGRVVGDRWVAIE